MASILGRMRGMLWRPTPPPVSSGRAVPGGRPGLRAGSARTVPPPSWGFRRRPAIALPASLDGEEVLRQLDDLPTLARMHGDAAVVEFLDGLLALPGISSWADREVRVLSELAPRLCREPRVDRRRLERCLRRIDGLLQRHDGVFSPEWLRLRGAASRIRTALAPAASQGRATSAVHPRMQANDLLAQALRESTNPLASVDAGAAYVACGEYEVAARCLQRALTAGVEDQGRAPFLLGQCSFQLEDYAEAERWFDRAVEDGWSRRDVVRWRAVALYELGRHADCERFAREALTYGENAGDAQLELLIGNVRLAAGDVDEASQRFGASVRDPSLYAEAQYGLGLAALARGNVDAARECFVAIESHPTGAVLASLGLGMVAADGGETDRAIAYLGAAARALPSHAPTHARLGACLFDRGEYLPALQHCRRARELGFAEPGLLIRGGLAALRTGDLAVAQEWLCAYRETADHIVDVEPFLRNVVMQRADAAVARGDFVEAAAHAETLSDGDPSSELAPWMSVVLYGAARQRLAAGDRAPEIVAWLAAAHELDQSEETRAGLVVAGVLGDGIALDPLISATESGEPEAFGSLAVLLAAYRRGDVETVERCREALGGDALAEFASVHLHLARSWKQGRADATALDRLQRVLGSRELIAALSEQRAALNVLAVALLFQGHGRFRPDRVLRTIETLAQDAPSDFWNEAIALAHLLIGSRAARGLSELRNAIAACRGLLDDDRPAIAELLACAERAEIVKLLEADRLDLTMIRARLEALAAAGHDDGLSLTLARSLDEFASAESLEAADLAARNGDVTRARQIWTALLSRGDSRAAHPFAVSLFREGFEQVQRKEDAAIATLQQALPLWRRVMDDDEHWERMHRKAEALGTNQYPYRPESIAEVRGSMARAALEVLANLGVRYVRVDQTPRATECVAAILRGPFDAVVVREVLEEVFARPLIPDVDALGGEYDASRLEATLRAAEIVLECDPENRRALNAAFRAASAQSQPALRRDVKCKETLPMFARVRRRLEHFPQRSIAADPSLRGACMTFWRDFSDMLGRTANEEVGAYNALGSRQSELGPRMLREVRKCVDTARKHVLPACAHWKIDAPDASTFENWDTQLTSNDFHRDSASEY